MKLSKKIITFGLSTVALLGLGASASLGAVKNTKYEVAKADTVDFESVISSVTTSFNYSYIDQLQVDFNISENVFNNKNYLNDHLSAYKDESNQTIDLSNGILINGKTFGYWVSYPSPNANIDVSANGIIDFPMRTGGVFSPVSLYIRNECLRFFFVLDCFPMDSIQITFKAGVFRGYNASTGKSYELNSDLTYYSTLHNQNNTAKANVDTKVSFVKVKNETVMTDANITLHFVPNDGENVDNGSGNRYYKYHVQTNIPRDSSLVNNSNYWVNRNYRYFTDNILMNGRPITYYNAWARLNLKDFTNLSDKENSRSDAYRTSNMSSEYDTAIQVRYYTDQDNYYFAIFVPNQIMDDLSLGEPGTLIFTIRDGSAWRSLDNESNPIVYRAKMSPYDHIVVDDFVASKMHMTDYDPDLDNSAGTNACLTYYLPAKVGFNSLTPDQKTLFRNYADFANPKSRYEAWAVANNDGAPYDGNATVVTPLHSVGVITQKDIIDNNDTLLIVLIGSLLVVSSFGLYFLIRRKRHQ